MNYAHLTNIKSIVFFGECMVENRANGDTGFAGDTFNTAWYLVQLIKPDSILAIYYATAIGDDPASCELSDLLKYSGIKTKFIATRTGMSLGQYWVKLDNFGERHFDFDRCNSPVKQYIKQHPALLEALRENAFDAIYLSGISLAVLCDAQRELLIQTLMQFKQRGGIIIFDNNYRSALWTAFDAKGWSKKIMALAEFVFLTDEDEYSVYGTTNVDEIIQYHFSQSNHPKTLVIRCGSDPCIVANKGSNTVLRISPKVIASSKITDTTAAGDAFAAGFLGASLNAKDYEESVKFAHRLAGMVIQYHGALIPKNVLIDFIDEES